MSELRATTVNDGSAEETGFTTMQLSYSTADIQKSIFFAQSSEERLDAPLRPSERDVGVGQVVYRMVDKEFYLVKDDAPPGMKPSTEKLGLLRPTHG